MQPLALYPMHRFVDVSNVAVSRNDSAGWRRGFERPVKEEVLQRSFEGGLGFPGLVRDSGGDDSMGKEVEDGKSKERKGNEEEED